MKVYFKHLITGCVEGEAVGFTSWLMRGWALHQNLERNINPVLQIHPNKAATVSAITGIYQVNSALGCTDPRNLIMLCEFLQLSFYYTPIFCTRLIAVEPWVLWSFYQPMHKLRQNIWHAKWQVFTWAAGQRRLVRGLLNIHSDLSVFGGNSTCPAWARFLIYVTPLRICPKNLRLLCDGKRCFSL